MAKDQIDLQEVNSKIKTMVKYLNGLNEYDWQQNLYLILLDQKTYIAKTEKQLLDLTKEINYVKLLSPRL